MTRLRPSTPETVLLVALAAGASGLAVVPSQQPPEHFIATQHATAVLAWAQTRCPWAGALKPGTPKVHAEDLMLVSAAFDSKARYLPLVEVCAQALTIAGRVSTAAGTTTPPPAGRNQVAAR